MKLSRYLIVASILYFPTLTAPASAIEGVCVTGSDGAPCLGDADDDWSPPIRRGPTPYQIEQQRRAAAAAAVRAARKQKASALIHQGVQCYNAKDYACAVGYAEQALKFSPDDSIIRENLAKARASLLNDEGIKADDDTAAIDHFRRALKFSPDDKTIRGNLAYSEAYLAYKAGNSSLAIAKMQEAINYSSNQERQDTLRDWQKKVDDAEREQKEVQAARTNIQQDVSNLLSTLQRPTGQDSGGSGTVPGQVGSFTFGIRPNPSGLQFKPAGQDPGINNDSAFKQLSSVEKSSRDAKNADSVEEMKREAGCQTADKACRQGDTAPPVIVNGVPRGSARLPAEVRTKMLTTENGKHLIDAEAKARADMVSAKAKLDAINKAIAAATDADKSNLGTIQSSLYQDWSNKTNIANSAALAIEEEARNHYGINFSEQPISGAQNSSDSQQPDKKAYAQPSTPR
jgi:hypothetical protein